MRLKDILLERLTEWEWLPQAVSRAVDLAVTAVSSGSPPPDPGRAIIGYAMQYLEQDPQIKSWTSTLEKPARFGLVNMGDPGVMGAAFKVDSSKFLDVVKSFWNRQTQSWNLGVTANLKYNDMDQLKNAIESTIGHEMSHVSQFNNQLKKGFVEPGTLKQMGYEFADILRNIAGQPSEPTRFDRSSTYLRPETEIRRPIAKDFFDRMAPEDKWVLNYRMNKLEFDAFAYSLGSGLRQQYGNQANAALNELANKIKIAGGGASQLTILGQPLNDRSLKIAVDQFNLLYDANDLGLLKGDPQQLWKKFMKETSRYTVAQATDHLATKAAIQRVKKLSQSQITSLIAKRLPQLSMQGTFSSIPLFGTAVGVAFAIPSLLKGDWIGGALSLGAGLTSNATGVGAVASWGMIVYAAAREIYNDVYSDQVGHAVTVEQDYAADPQGTRDRIKELADQIYADLKAGFQTNYPKLTGTQAQQNMRQAQTGMDTPANPNPRLHPELYPQQESLDRIVGLSKYKS